MKKLKQKLRLIMNENVYDDDVGKK